MRRYKRNCAVGCDIASRIDEVVDAEARAKMAKWGDPSDDGYVFSGDDVDKAEEELSKWLRVLRSACYDECHKACEASEEATNKCTHACSAGCDNFFNDLK